MSEARSVASQQTRRIALLGNPNTGKSTLFNQLTGGRARVGNYTGITVSALTGRIDLDGTAAELVDLPGTYSLVARSPDEKLAVDLITGPPPVECAIVCCDVTNLLRNLYLVLQLQELGQPVVVALTMLDEVDGEAPSARSLHEALGCRVIPVNPRTGAGLDALKRAVQDTLEGPPAEPLWRWTPSDRLASVLDELGPASRGDRALALWGLLSAGEDEIELPPLVREVAAREGGGFDDEVVTARYAWLDRQIGPLVTSAANRVTTERADRVLLHPVLGFGVFLLIMGLVFQGLFVGADPFIGLIEEAFGWLGALASDVAGGGLLGSFLADGVIGGVGSVLVFLPQIILLFFVLSLLEDTGYMARVAYLMDRVMRPLGLHGRAFVPMLSGFACAVPAILATRTMSRRRDRFLTMAIIPLMTCAARLPVYTLIIASLFPAGTLLGIFPVQGVMMMVMYAFSVLIALVSGLVLSKTLLPAPPSPLVLELPPYRMPRLRDVWRQTWRGTRHFLEDAGGIIFVMAVVMWGLLTFPRATPEDLAPLTVSEQAAFQVEQSYAGQLGHAIEPALRPLGWDWKIGVGMIGAFAAREVFVSTLGTVYALGADVDEEDVTLREHMRSERKATGEPVWTPLVGISVMVFIALGAQCMSTLAVMKRETQSWRWPVFQFAWMTALAYVASLLVFQVGRLLGFG